MGEAPIKFEVFVEQNSRWVINSVALDEREAINEARKLLASKTVPAVQVIRERVGVLGRVFSTVIYEERRSERKAEIRPNPIEDMAPLCADLAAFYGSESRRLIGRALKTYLDKCFLSPTELLHSFVHMNRLGDTGSLLYGAVQQVALAQSRATQEPAKDRARQVHELVDQAMLRGQAVEADRQRLKLGTGGLAALIAEATQRHPAGEREFRLRYAVAEHLADGRGWLDKLDRLVQLAGDGNQAPVAALLDPFLGDMLRSAAAVRDLLGSQEDLFGALNNLLLIVRGPHDGRGTEVPELTRKLSAMIVAHGMPETRAALVDRVAKGLEGGVRLTKGDAQDELAAFRRLIGQLRENSGTFIGGPRMHEAMSRRSGRWLAPETLEQLVPPPKQPKERFEQLLSLEKIVFGDRNKDILGGYLNELIDNPRTRDIMFGKAGSVIDKMRVLAKLQIKVQESELPLVMRNFVAANLDGAVLGLLVEHKVLDKVEQGNDDFVQRAMRLLHFCRSDALTEGKALELVRERAQGYLKQPRFLSLYTADAKSDAEREKMLRDLQALLADAGLL